MADTEAEIVDRLAGHLAKGSREGLLELAGLVIAMRRRIVELEQRPVLKYSGTFLAGITYSPGEFVTQNGSLFYCERQTKSKPGTDGNWKLCVKNGTFK